MKGILVASVTCNFIQLCYIGRIKFETIKERSYAKELLIRNAAEKSRTQELSLQVQGVLCGGVCAACGKCQSIHGDVCSAKQKLH